MPISVTRFEAEEVKNYFDKKKIKVGITHLWKLKPFNLSNKDYKHLKKSKYGVLMTIMTSKMV